MENPFFDNRILLPSSLSNTGELLAKFAECSLFTFSAKDIKTYKIFIHNKTCANLYGLEADGLVGMTSRECLEQIKPFTHKEDALQRWEKEDAKVITTNRVQINTITILDFEGFLRVRQHLTVPVHNKHKQIAAIAAFCYDRTSHINLLNLFRTYQQYYPKIQAISQLSKYLGLDKSFQLPLTTGELYTLLALVQAPRHKQAAYLLSALRKKPTAPATIAGYIERIKDKLKPYQNLETVLSYLRGLNQWTPDPDIF